MPHADDRHRRLPARDGLGRLPSDARARRPARARRERRRHATVRRRQRASDGIAVLGPQRAPNCLSVRATTVANRANSVVLACSDPNGDKIALTIVRKPAHGTLGGSPRRPAACSTGPRPATRGPTRSPTRRATARRERRRHGHRQRRRCRPRRRWCASARVARTCSRQKRIHVLVDCPPTAIGPCRFATHLIVDGRSTATASRARRAARRPHRHPRGRA